MRETLLTAVFSSKPIDEKMSVMLLVVIWTLPALHKVSSAGTKETKTKQKETRRQTTCLSFSLFYCHTQSSSLLWLLWLQERPCSVVRFQWRKTKQKRKKRPTKSNANITSTLTRHISPALLHTHPSTQPNRRQCPVVNIKTAQRKTISVALAMWTKLVAAPPTFNAQIILVFKIIPIQKKLFFLQNPLPKRGPTSENQVVSI